MSNRREISVMKILFIILLINQYGFFMLIPNAKITRGLAFIPWISLVIVLIMLCLTPSSNDKDKSDGFGKLVIAFLSINIISFIWIVLWYKTIDMTAFTALGYASLSLVYFPLIKMKEKHDLYRLMVTINIIAVTIILVQVFFYNKTGQLIINSVDVQKLGMRHGLRITYYDFMIMITLLISMTRLSEKNSGLYRLNCILSVVYIVYVSQTRYWEVLVLALLIVIAVLPIISDLSQRKINIIYILIAPVVIIATFLVARKLFVSLIAPLLDGSYKGNGSYFARLGEIDFFTDIIKSHPLFGTGNLTATSTSDLWYILHGPQGIYYTQDIGLYGDIARLGLGILLLFVLILKKIFNKIYLNRINAGLIIVVLGSIGSISIFTNGLMLGLIFSLMSCTKGKSR